jgi:hypothetical protein
MALEMGHRWIYIVKSGAGRMIKWVWLGLIWIEQGVSGMKLWCCP